MVDSKENYKFDLGVKGESFPQKTFFCGNSKMTLTDRC